jgi:McKusick-Kaufman syndrome protein
VKSPLPSLYKGLLIEDGHCTGIDHAVQLPLTFFNKKGHIITAVFNISLAGDQPDGFIDKISIEASSLCDSSALQGEVIYQELMDVGRSLIERNVEVVLCQKCVHPSLRNVLEHQGVVVVERLGSTYIDAVISITGGHVISSLSSVDTAHLGSLTMVTMVTIGDNRYLQVDGCGVPHASLMLPYLLEIIGEELKSVVFSCVKVLEGLLYQPRLVNGGGCVLTQLAHYVHHQLNQADDDTLKKLMCSRRTFTDVSHCIQTSLFQTCSSLVYNSRDDIALTDSQTHHCWIISDASPLIRTCSCGSINVTSLSEPQWIPLHGVNEMDPLIPDELTTHTTSANIPPAPHIWDSLPQTVASLNISKQLATTFITTYKIHH